MKNALQQDAHFSKGEQKPVCLIVDEVDGAVAGGVGFEKVAEFLRNCIHRAAPAKTDSDDDEKENRDMPSVEGNNMIFKRRKGPRRNDNIFELQRPIIFICNDMWTKALRPLKEISIQVKIERSNEKRLI